MYVGFALAAYSIVANDSIQTLGTFLSSNSKRPWWALWIFVSGIMILTVGYGWFANSGDPAFGRLAQKGVESPDSFTWLYVVAPAVLLILTRSGVPVSTTFLVLTAFSSLTAIQMGKSPKEASDLLGSMFQKSLVGYALAFVFGLAVFRLIVGGLEKKFFKDSEAASPHQVGPAWVVFQWFSTGFLWSMWLIQDLANIFVYLPRKIEFPMLAVSLLGMAALQGVLIRGKGGRIQQVVLQKTNTTDIRSATLIDLSYGLMLLFFKVDYIPKLFAALGLEVPWPPKMPMSTTWVFLGLLAGRELGLNLRLRHLDKKQLSRLIFTDAGKLFIGMVVGVVIAFGLPLFAGGPATEVDGPNVEAASSAPTPEPTQEVVE